MISFPPAKINLGLVITGRRSDGFHNLETVFYPVPWHDVLEIVAATEAVDEMVISGLTVPGNPADNLCSKALALVREKYDIPPVRIFLHKVIPMGSGLGGGSSDAAHTLLLLNDLFRLGMNETTLMELAARLGSDVPFFIRGVPSQATGRGEILTPLTFNLKGYHLVLVVPDVHMSTREAYSLVTPSRNKLPLSQLLNEPVTNWKEVLTNDFEPVVFGRYPQVREIRNLLYNSGADFAAMTGSGSAVYGIFSHAPHTLPDLAGSHLFSKTL